MISIVQCCCNILGGGGKHATDLSPMPGNKLFGVDNIAINFINPTFDSMTKTWLHQLPLTHNKKKPNFLPGLTDMTKNVSLRWLLLRDFTV